MLLHEITLKKLLSFGPDTAPLALKPLNVFIGPNGSGKSNLIEAVNLLRWAPLHLATPIRDGGGIRDWLWKGEQNPTASLEVVVDNPAGKRPLRHTFSFTEVAQRFELVDEKIEDCGPCNNRPTPYVYYKYQNGRPILAVQGKERELERKDFLPDDSILSQRRDPDQYAEVTYLGQAYQRVSVYREWTFGRYAAARRPQEADLPNEHLEEDFRNLGLVLNRLGRDPAVKKRILDNLNELYASIQDFYVSIEGGTVQVFFHEMGFTIPATRLSDGTLRYLCLLAILCDPTPPPLICIEEPELGLHPDILPTIARLLKEASQRTQLIVTTHSDIIIDELTDEPESVIVCERHDGQTRMKRLDAGALAGWLEKYRLGQLWTQGELGGVRW